MTVRGKVKHKLIEDFISGKRLYRCTELIENPHNLEELEEAYNKDPENYIWPTHDPIGETFTKIPEDYWRFGIIFRSSLCFADRTFIVEVWVEEPAEQPTVEPFRTGSAGRPTASAQILAEFQRRVREGEVVPRRGGLKGESKHLATWWAGEQKKHSPPGPPVTAGTVENQIRKYWQEISKTTK